MMFSNKVLLGYVFVVCIVAILIHNFWAFANNLFSGYIIFLFQWGERDLQRCESMRTRWRDGAVPPKTSIIRELTVQDLIY